MSAKGLPPTDYRGMRLCQPCWDGEHYSKLKGQAKLCRCEGVSCECPCAELMKPVRRKKKDTTEQRNIVDEFGTIEVK